MGQRTQLLLIKKSSTGKKVEFYHNQWGFGKQMFNAIMNLTLQVYHFNEFKAKNPDDYFLSHVNVTLDNYQDICHVFTQTAEEYDTKMKADIADFESCLDILSTGDNNNGYCVVQIEKKGMEYDIKFGFIRGEESLGYDVIPKGFCSADEYAKYEGGGYCNDEFMDMFHKFCDCFGIEDVTKLKEGGEK